jgi:hypothetical protein
LLCCPLEQEAWNAHTNSSALAGRLYSQICGEYLVHELFADRPEMCSHTVRLRYYDGSTGVKPASAVSVKGAGHMLVQEVPDAVAKHIVRILNSLKEKGHWARL